MSKEISFQLLSDCIYFILYSGDWKNDEVWDPNFAGLADDEITIRNMGVDWVRKEWMTEEFMGFVFKYAGPVSQTSKVLLERIQDYPDNIMYLVSKSDVAWALLVYVNNIDYWTSELEKAKAAQGRGGNKTKRKAGRGRPKKADDGEVKVKRKWTGTKKPVSGDHGYNSDGMRYAILHPDVQSLWVDSKR